jgi:hypothetical protein
MRTILPGAMDEGALMDACYELASRMMFKSEEEPSGIRLVAEKFFTIAREHSGFVPESEDRNIVVRAVCYVAEVHAFYHEKGDIRWFHEALTILLELAHPSETPGAAGEPLLSDIEEGIRKARSRFT